LSVCRVWPCNAQGFVFPDRETLTRRHLMVEKKGARSVGSDRVSSVEEGLIVGVGASAGGLAAFSSFLAAMPADSGMAFVLVQHLSPQHKSILTDLLARTTRMVVLEADDDMPIAADHVYVIPPDSTLTIKQRRIRISRPAPPRERRRPIDTFFFSLAEDQGENAICIVLSGTGTDGSLGLKIIKESGGLTIAQAEFDHTAMSGMPQSAAATGLVDHVLPVEQIPAKLLEYRDHLRQVASKKDGDGVRNDATEHLAAITTLLRLKTDHDFSKYKKATVVRRVQRRMQVLQIDATSAYVTRLRDDPREAELLFRELLIGVTQFFRDPDAFAALQEKAIANIIEGKSSNDIIRVWVPGCSTGEEAYSLAILLKEEMERQGRHSRIQLFAADLDDNAVAFARSGRYRKTTGLSAERLKRWFSDDGDEACPIKSIREGCVFSLHSVVKDPPFSRLDLISCRNLLIYMDHELQDRIIQTFHYALNPGGILFLGHSEGVGREQRRYVALDRKHHIFRRADVAGELPRATLNLPDRPSPLRVSPYSGAEDSIERSTRRALAKYSPVYMVVDRQHNILRFSGGEIARYLEPSAGAANLSLFNNLRKSLQPTVRAALHTALSSNESVNHDVDFKSQGQTHPLTVIVEPISERGVEDAFFVIAFVERQNAVTGTGKHDSIASQTDATDIAILNKELSTTKMQLQAAIDDLEKANEGSRSLAEEYQSVNEELQSTNEELETSKEEMQSVNEELQTINAEMFAKNEALTVLNSDFKNLLDSTQIATIFLDDEFCIKSFTPGMTDIFRLRESDRGRPITDIVTLVDYPELSDDFRRVLRDLATIEREVKINEPSATFIMRIRPYRTLENVINGVVMTFVDITARKRADVALQVSEARFSAIVKQATVGVAETDLSGQYILTNARYREVVGRSEEELLALRLHDLVHPEDMRPDQDLFDRVTAEGKAFEREMRLVRPDGTFVWVQNNVSPLVGLDRKPYRVLTITLEIGERKRAEEQKSLLLGELDHRVKNILSIISAVIAQTLKTSTSPESFGVTMEGRIAAIARAHSLLTEGGRGAVSLRDLVLTELAPFDRANEPISVTGPPVELTPRAGLALAMAIHELASNAAKYGALSTSTGKLSVAWRLDPREAGMLHLQWIESGGPPLTEPPSRRGFGTTLIERTLSHELDAVVKREFLAAGLRCTIDMPSTAEVIHVAPKRTNN
jgi:two-component system, chemotaxis family, CheB/CheR fusion protein